MSIYDNIIRGYINKVSGTTVPSISGVGSVNTSLSGAKNSNTIAGRSITSSDYSNFVNTVKPKNQYLPELNSAISGIKDYANGISKVDQTIANKAEQNFKSTQAVNTIANAQRIASNPYLTQGARNAAIMESNRVSGSQYAQLEGDLAQQAQERAYTASTKLVDVLQNAAQLDEQMFVDNITAIQNDLSRELQASIANGSLTATEVSMNLEKWGKQLDSVISDRNYELDKLKVLGDMAIGDQTIQQQQIANQNTKINLWQTTAANAVLELKNTNPNVTVSDIMSNTNSYAYQALKNTYNAINGTDGETPSDTWISTFMNTVKTEQQTNEENITNGVSYLKTALTGLGLSDSVAGNVSSYFETVQRLGNGYTENEDGSITLLGSDGNPFLKVSDKGIFKVNSDGKTTEELEEIVPDEITTDLSTLTTSVADGNDLLTSTTNFKKALELYSTNPSEVENSDLFFKFPIDKISDNVNRTTTKYSLKNETRFSVNMKQQITDNIGKIVSIPYGDKNVTGVLYSLSEFPMTVQIVLKMPDGSYKTVAWNGGSKEMQVV
jgi:hypothetical protein